MRQLRYTSVRPWFLFTLLAFPFSLLAQSYFQQQVDYRIDVRLDDAKHELSAYEEFDYTNNSPTTLDTLWIHLWPNAYKDRSTALCEQLDRQNNLLLHFAEERARGWIDSLDFKSAGVALTWGLDRKNIDIAWIKLPAPLAPGQRLTITTPFHVKIPSARISRLGHVGQAYYITQWFPKPAVYDNRGWHAMPYLTQGEFYSEFGTFDVRITLPANYVVGATGQLKDPSERAWMDSLSTVPFSDDQKFYTRKQRERLNATPPSSVTTKTLHFQQENVHDFAWFADKRFIVRKGSVHLDRSGRDVTTWALFTPRGADVWKDAVTYVNESVRLYSQWVGDYPYSNCTAIDGGSAAGGGMEYPMITIINDSDNPFDLDVVIAHEVGHNWFYGMLGSNEREHPWMDEGVNSYYEQRYVETRYPGRRMMDLQGIPLGLMTDHQGITYRQQNELQYRYNARRNQDSPPDTQSNEFGELDYGTTVYSKSAVVFDNLRATLGTAVFDSCMQRYFDHWHFKHPYPEDLYRELGAYERPGLLAQLNEALETANKVDRHGGTGQQSIVPEIDPRNDVGGLRFPEIKFLAGLEREDRKSIYWTPAIGLNAHDGWMGGVTLRNTTLPSQRFEWVAAPLYGFKSERLAGGARFVWNHDLLRSPALRNIHLGVSAFSASLPAFAELQQWYQRVVPFVQIDPRSKPNGIESSVRYRVISLWDHVKGDLVTQDRTISIDETRQDVFHELRLNAERHRGLNPFTANLTALHHEAFTRLSLDVQREAVYDVHRHRLTVRLFGGAFLRKKDGALTTAMGWRMHWGSSDLLYDHLFFDRQFVGDNTAKQFVKDQGGFKTPTAAGTSDSWIAAANLEFDLPFRLPVAFFASYGAAPFTIIDQNGRRNDWKGYWEAGLGVRIVRDVVEMWVPLAYSNDIKNEIETVRGFTFTDRIRFVFALERMDPTQFLRKAPH